MGGTPVPRQPNVARVHVPQALECGSGAAALSDSKAVAGATTLHDPNAQLVNAHGRGAHATSAGL